MNKLRKIKKLYPAVLGFMLISFVSCAKVGRNFDSVLVNSIKTDKTTREEVRSLLGNPFRVGLDSGDPTWTYVFDQWFLFKPAISKDLTLRFNYDGVVTSYSYNTNYSDKESEN